MDKFTQALASLLPTGFAWPRHAGSVLMRWLRGTAAAYAEMHRFIDATTAQWLPHRTTLRLREWEEACGLPDACFGPGQTEAERRAVLLARLRGIKLPYTDSSPAAPGVTEQLCAELGYTATVKYNTPFRCGVNRVGDRLGALDGKLYVLVQTAIQPFRAGVNRVGDRLIATEKDLWPLYCYMRKIVAARYEVIVLYSPYSPV